MHGPPFAGKAHTKKIFVSRVVAGSNPARGCLLPNGLRLDRLPPQVLEPQQHGHPLQLAI
jgi:hypothetical protein